MVAGAAAMDTLRACLAAAVPIETRGTDSLASGAPESRSTLTDAFVRRAGCPIFTVTGQRTIGAPAAFSTHAVTVDT